MIFICMDGSSGKCAAPYLLTGAAASVLACAFAPHLRHLDGLTRRFGPANFLPEKGEDAYEIEVVGCRRRGCSGFVCARRKRPIIH
jgi:hypothetical protein